MIYTGTELGGVRTRISEFVSTRGRDSVWDKIWRDKHGDIVIYQHPNVWLIGWAILACISLFVPRGTNQEVFWWLSNIVLAIWALLEIFKGVNYFRRGLGLFVLLVTIAGAFGVGR
jgi:hypothetical protein